MKKLLSVLLALGVTLIFTACNTDNDEVKIDNNKAQSNNELQAAGNSDELKTYNTVSLGTAGFSFVFPDDGTGQDPAGAEISKKNGFGLEYFYTVVNKPFSDTDKFNEGEQVTFLYSNVNGQLDVNYCLVGAYACCKLSDLKSHNEKYFLVNGNYITKKYAEQFHIADIGEWAVYDFSEMFLYCSFNDYIDDFYSKGFAEYNDNQWLKDFRQDILKNVDKYIR